MQYTLEVPGEPMTSKIAASTRLIVGVPVPERNVELALHNPLNIAVAARITESEVEGSWTVTPGSSSTNPT